MAAVKEQMFRERHSLLETQSAMESEKAEVQAFLRSEQEQRFGLIDQLACCNGDREFCYEIIRGMMQQMTGT